MGSLSGPVVVLLVCLSTVMGAFALTGRLEDHYDKWSSNVVFTPEGKGVTLSLDALSAAGIGSKDKYVFGSFGAWIMLPKGDSAGTVTTFYMSSPGPNHCEFDFEFLGNSSGEPILLHTNVFVNGEGGREQQIFLWFDPTADFHYYSFEWHSDMLVFFVDWKPIRMYKNIEGTVQNWKYANHQAMGIYLSIWDGSEWATQGGRIKLNWASAPFTSTYKDFTQDGCYVNPLDESNGVTACQSSTAATGPGLTPAQQTELQTVRSTAKYTYCDDLERYPDMSTRYPECSHNIL